MKILIVEDEPALRDIYAMLFRMEGFTVYEAENGAAAISELRANRPDVIILDVLMPVMNGIEFLQAIDAPKNYSQVKILVLSNLSDAKTREQIMKLGATGYMLKSGLAPHELLEAIKKL